LRRLVTGAKEAGVPVLFGPMAYTEEDYTDERLQARSGINRLMFEAKMFLAGSWGADFHPDLQPTATDIILEPHKGTDVFETDLPHHLERLGTEQLVIAGMTANLCCESTGRHATEHGHHVTFISDAIGAASLPAYEASIHVNYPMVANAVLEVDEFLAAVAESLSALDPQPGDSVVGSDRGAIGEIEEVVPPTADTPGYVRVPRGIVLEKDTYIPWDAVTHRTGGHQVYINVPKLVVGKLPWDKPPSPQMLAEKRGPAPAQVTQLYRSHHPTGLSG
jgi:nicotinamidase-related amidase